MTEWNPEKDDGPSEDDCATVTMTNIETGEPMTFRYKPTIS